MVSRKSKIVCSVKVSRLEFVSLPIADQLQPHFYKLPRVEHKITKLDWKSTMCSVVKCPWNFFLHTFVFNIFWVFNTLYLHNWHQILASFYDIGTIRKILLCNFHSYMPWVHCSCTCLYCEWLFFTLWCVFWSVIFILPAF